MGRLEEVAALTKDALEVANAAVEREAGNVGALRSRALLRSRVAQAALDAFDYPTAERLALETAADWTEFLRFDEANDTARNNRRVARGLAAQAQWRMGEFDKAIAIGRENTRDNIAVGGSPSTVRGTAFQTEVIDNLEADLGRVTDVDAALVESNRLRALGASQVEPESYFRFVNPVWNENQRADLLLRMGRTEEALAAARSVATKFRSLAPVAGSEKQTHRFLLQANAKVQTEAFLQLGRWAEAAQVARDLIRDRPSLDDTSPGELDTLASDRALAAVALARNGEPAEARTLLGQATEVNRARRAAGANDHGSRFQTALIRLAAGLLAEAPEEKRRLLAQGLAEIAAMNAQPRQMRSVRELQAVLARELSRVSG